MTSQSLTLSVAEVAEVMGVSTHVVYQRIREGVIPVVLNGKSLRTVKRIPRAWIDEELAGRNERVS